ncbi:Cytochrome c oxidase assembly protein cox19, partial [Podochytrium sp. JEL0797]
MSMGNSFQRNQVKAIPPERGAFPLDIEGLCKIPMESYMKCMREQKSGSSHQPCRELSQAYIECRMKTKLMEEDRMDNIGFGKPGRRSDEAVGDTASTAGSDRSAK